MQAWPNVIVENHPLVSHELAILRNKQTPLSEFHASLTRLAFLLAHSATANLKTEEIEFETPLQKTKGKRLSQGIVLAPILRSGVEMLPAFRQLLPTARVCFLGIRRDEATALPQRYYCNAPKDIKDDLILILDPMLATGGSACDAIRQLKDLGAVYIRIVSIIAAPQGLDKVTMEHPDVVVYTAVVDKGLNQNKYIVPGLGDVGDRSYGTC